MDWQQQAWGWEEIILALLIGYGIWMMLLYGIGQVRESVETGRQSGRLEAYEHVLRERQRADDYKHGIYHYEREGEWRV